MNGLDVGQLLMWYGLTITGLLLASFTFLGLAALFLWWVRK